MLRRPGHLRCPCGSVVAVGHPAAFPLAQGAGEAVPGPLHRPGRGVEPDPDLTVHAGARAAAGVRLSWQRGAEVSPRPERRSTRPQAVRPRRGQHGPGPGPR
ncbi:hypothetical protein [Kitasatospora sp. NPDC001175]|uniref:hypothetical protein n=1 Tax=Kitasatospora sp. NPDC001175 TaxID=3157103 RepID=UPI003D06E748